jgi:CRP-like cAMP-binding protein
MGDFDVGKMLRRVSLFANVDDETLEKLGKLVITKKYPKDALVFAQNEMGNAMYFIVSGRVRVVLYGENGKEITLTFLDRRDFFGEMSLLDEKPRSANVITTEASNMLILKRSVFFRYIKSHPEMAVSVLIELSRRLRKADDIISNLALLDVYGRVARVLVELSKSDGEETEDGTLIRKRPTQQDIASMVNSSRETVSRVLSEFQRRGLLVIDGKQVILRPQFYFDF